MVNIVKGNKTEGDLVLRDKKVYEVHINNYNIKDESATDIADKFIECNIFDTKTFNYIFSVDPVDINEIFIDPDYNVNSFYLEEIIEKNKYIDNFIQNAQEILCEQGLLVIYGPYGSGKSIASKIISNKFFKMGYNVLFFKFIDILENYNYNIGLEQLETEILNNKNQCENILCVFDGYDEINFLNDQNYEKSVKVLRSILMLTRNKGIKVLINTRINKGTEIDFFNKFNYEVGEQCGILNLKMIELVYSYNKKKINDWIDSYRIQNNSDIDISVSLLESGYKKIYSSFSNPLFVYMMCHMIYKYKNIDNINSIYNIYKCFVDSTAKGKFKFEDKFRNKPLDKIIGMYREFLTDLAMVIYKNSDINIDANQLLDKEVLMDLNNDIYEVLESNIGENIQNIISEIGNSLSERRVELNVLNCYFLERNSGKWRFKDNNIMYFLIAEALYENVIVRIINMQQTNSIKSFNINNFSKYSRIKLHPIILEMLLDKIKNDSQENRKLLMEGITFLLSQGKILNIQNYEAVNSICVEKINFDIIISLVYIILNEGSYDDKNLSYFFKRFYSFVNMLKPIDIKSFYTIKRFFKESKIYSIELKRMNLSWYNFTKSQLSNVDFIQDKMYSTIMREVTFKDTLFSLCNIDKLTIENIEGNLTFENCYIQSLELVNGKGNLDIVFKRCYINQMDINHMEHKIALDFYNCEIGRFAMNHCMKNNSLKINKGYYPELKLNNCKMKIQYEEVYGQKLNINKIGCSANDVKIVDSIDNAEII